MIRDRIWSQFHKLWNQSHDCICFVMTWTSFSSRLKLKKKDEKVGVPSCGEINPYQDQLRPPPPHPKASLSPLGASAYYSELHYSFFQKPDSRVRKKGPVGPIFLPSRAACGEMDFTSASLIMGHTDSTCSWLEGAPLWSQAPLAPPPSCFSPSLTCHRKPVKQAETWGPA